MPNEIIHTEAFLNEFGLPLSFTLSLEFTTVSFPFSAPLYATVVLTQTEIPSPLNGILCVSTCSQHAAVVLSPSSSGSVVGEHGHHAMKINWSV